MKIKTLAALTLAAFALTGCASQPASVFCEFRPAPTLMAPGAPVPQTSGHVSPRKLRTAYYRAVEYARFEHRLRGALQASVRDHQARCEKLRKRLK